MPNFSLQLLSPVSCSGPDQALDAERSKGEDAGGCGPVPSYRHRGWEAKEPFMS